MREGKWIRSIGTVAAFVVLAIVVFHRGFRVFFVGSRPDTTGILLYLALTLMPAFAAVFLSAFARFWWTFYLGLWFLFLSAVFCIDDKASPTAMLLILGAATMCITPFLNRACRAKRLSTNGDAQPTDPGDKQ